MKIKKLYIVILLFSLTTTVLGQKISEHFCENINDSVTQIIKPEKTYRQDFFNSSCIFEFNSNKNERVYISVEMFTDNKKARSELKSNLEYFLIDYPTGNSPKFSRAKLIPTKKWDTSFFYKSTYQDNFMLLQQQNFDITIISTHANVILKLEKILAKISFN